MSLKKSLKSAQKASRKCSDSPLKVLRKSEIIQNVIRKSSKSPQKVLRKCSECVQKLFRKFLSDHQKVLRKSIESPPSTIQFWYKNLSIFKGKSNIITDASVTTTNRPNNLPSGYRASPDFWINGFLLGEIWSSSIQQMILMISTSLNKWLSLRFSSSPGYE